MVIATFCYIACGKTPMPIQYEAVWAPKKGLDIVGREKYIILHEIESKIFRFLSLSLATIRLKCGGSKHIKCVVKKEVLKCMNE
jgi:hypothetical protein